MNANEINPSQQNVEKKPDYSPKWAVLLGNAYYLQKQEMTVKYANNPADLFEYFKNIKKSKELFSATNITPVLEHTKEVVVRVGVGRKASQDEHVVALVKEGDRLQHDAIYAQNAGDLERVSKEARRVFVDTVVNASKGNGSRYEGKLVEVDGVYIPENEAFKLQKNENPDEKYVVGSIIKTFDPRSKDVPVNVSTSSKTGDVELSLVPKEGEVRQKTTENYHGYLKSFAPKGPFDTDDESDVEVHTAPELKKFGEPWTDKEKSNYQSYLKSHHPLHEGNEDDMETPTHGDGAVPPIPPKPPRGGDDGKFGDPYNGKDPYGRTEPTMEKKDPRSIESVERSVETRKEGLLKRLKNLGLTKLAGTFETMGKHPKTTLAAGIFFAGASIATGGALTALTLAFSSLSLGSNVYRENKIRLEEKMKRDGRFMSDVERRKMALRAMIFGTVLAVGSSYALSGLFSAVKEGAGSLHNWWDNFTSHAPASSVDTSSLGGAASSQAGTPPSAPPSGVDVTPSTPPVSDAPSASVTTPPSVPNQLQTAASTPPASTVVTAPEVAPPVDLMAAAQESHDRVLRAGLDAYRIARGGHL